MSTRPSETDPRTGSAAADWLIRLRESPGDERLLSEWLQWREENPENAAAFERTRAVWEAFDSPELRAHAQSLRAPSGRLRGPRSRQWLSVRALAASLLVAVSLAVGWNLRANSGAQVFAFATVSGQNSSHVLPDGSRVELGAHSQLRARFTAGRREVTVEAGEAYFEVAKDAARPFIVKAGDVRVTAVGTAFNVRRASDRAVVTVSEGKVKLAPERPFASLLSTSDEAVQVAAGEQAVYSESSRRIAVAHVDPAFATAWRQGLLKFIDEPLEAVVADLNRYTTHPIVVADSSLARRTFTGTFYRDRADEWINALGHAFDVEVQRGDSGTVVLVPRALAPPQEK